MIRMRGTGGELRVGGVVAARLHRWTLENEVVVADADIDEFWFTAEGRRSLRVTIGGSLYVWNDVVVSGEQTLSIRLSGKPEVRG